jgi:hypothetical protein
MMTEVKARLLELRLSGTQIHSEAFGTVMRNPTTKSVRSTLVAGKVAFQTSNLTVMISADQIIP